VNENSGNGPNDRTWLHEVGDLFTAHLRSALTLTVVVTVMAMLGGAIYMFWLQPVRKSAVLQFRPAFAGAQGGAYPNGLPFSATDITASPVLDAVYDRNQLAAYCGRDFFRSGFFVEQRSMAVAMLDGEYQARLAEARVTAVDRERLMAEYQAKLAGIQLEYRLNFVAPGECNTIPNQILTKVMSDVLLVWAEDSELRRGVMKLRVPVITPSLLDVALKEGQPRLIRADLIRTSIDRVVANIKDVEALPGSELVRLAVGPAPVDPQAPDTRPTVSLVEVRSRLEDLVRSQLEPLIVSAGRSFGRASVFWVDETLATAIREKDTAERRAQVYLSALQIYSGVAPTTGPSDDRRAPAGVPSDVQALTPQIDRTFIDRMVEMSDGNTNFRQELTRQHVLAQVAAVNLAGNVRYYEHLKGALNNPSAVDMEPAAVDAALEGLVAEGKGLIGQFNQIYDQISKVAFRPAAGLYQVERPVGHSLVRGFSMRSYATFVAGALIITPLLALFWWFATARLTALFGRRR